jgi:hypothetical protein
VVLLGTYPQLLFLVIYLFRLSDMFDEMVILIKTHFILRSRGMFHRCKNEEKVEIKKVPEKEMKFYMKWKPQEDPSHLIVLKEGSPGNCLYPIKTKIINFKKEGYAKWAQETHTDFIEIWSSFYLVPGQSKLN